MKEMSHMDFFDENPSIECFLVGYGEIIDIDFVQSLSSLFLQVKFLKFCIQQKFNIVLASICWPLHPDWYMFLFC